MILCKKTMLYGIIITFFVLFLHKSKVVCRNKV